MKIHVLNNLGKTEKEIDSKAFDSETREDIVQKVAEIEKMNRMPEWAPYIYSGMDTSASGNVKHNRHVWKSDRGKGMARIPKKKMSRTGERFHWVGAVIPGTKGGRRAHPPKLGGRILKINKKEFLLALKSALAMIANPQKVQKKYSSLNDSKLNIKLPIVIGSDTIGLQTGEFLEALGKILGSSELEEVAIQKKSMRAGIGKMRGRKYKKSAGLLLVLGNKESKKINGIDIVNANNLIVSDLASNGARLCAFSEQAIKDIEEKLGLRKAERTDKAEKIEKVKKGEK